MRYIIRWYTLSRVHDADAQLSVVQVKRKVYFSMRRREVHGVLDKIGEHPFDHADIRMYEVELFGKVGPHYYDRLDIEMTAQERTQVESRLPELRPDSIAGLAVTGIDSTDGLRFKLEDGAWALIRLSGTEPLMRIYTEVPREALVPRALAECRELAGV